MLWPHHFRLNGRSEYRTSDLKFVVVHFVSVRINRNVRRDLLWGPRRVNVWSNRWLKFGPGDKVDKPRWKNHKKIWLQLQLHLALINFDHFCWSLRLTWKVLHASQAALDRWFIMHLPGQNISNFVSKIWQKCILNYPGRAWPEIQIYFLIFTLQV